MTPIVRSLASAAASTLLVVLVGCTSTPERLSAPPPPGSDAETARLSDLDTGLHVAGIPLAAWADVPEEGEFRMRPMARKAGRYRKDSGEVVLEDIRAGDFEELRVEFAAVAREQPTDERMRDRQSPLSGPAIAVGVIAIPLWRDPAPNASGAVEPAGAEQPPVRPSELGAELARFGLELGEPYGLSEELGPLFETSRNGTYAILEPGATGGAPRLRAIARALEPEFFASGGRWTLDWFYKYVDALIFFGDVDQFLRFEQFAQEATRVGVNEPAALFARLEAEANDAVAHGLKVYAEAFDTGGPKERLLIARDLAVEGVAAAGCVVPSAAVEALRRCLVGASARLDETSKEAIDAQRPFDAATYALLARNLRDDRSLETTRPSGAIGHAELSELAERLAGCTWVLDQLGESEGKSLLEKLKSQGALTLDPTRPKLVAPEFLRLAGAALASEFEVSAREAAAKDLHGTACARFLIADGLRTGGEGKGEAQTLIQAHTQLGSAVDAHDARTEMIRQGCELAARIVPFVDGIHTDGKYAESAYDGELMLGGMPFSAPDRVGLKTGNRTDQEAFANYRGVKVLVVDVKPVVFHDIEQGTYVDAMTKTIYSDYQVSNRDTVIAWRSRVDNVLRQIDNATADMVGAAADSQRIRAYGPVTGVYGTDPHWEVETQASLKARMESESSAAYSGRKVETLRAQYEALLAERPADVLVENVSRLATYPREVQKWRIPITREVELSGGATPYLYSGDNEYSYFCYRIDANPEYEIEAVDGWTTEEAIRAGGSLDVDTPSRSDYASFGVRSCLRQRLEEYEAWLLGRELSDQERRAEWTWTLYFFTLRNSATELTRQEEVVQFAFLRVP